MGRPERTERIGAEIEGMIEAGDIRPIIGARFALENAADALVLLDERRRDRQGRPRRRVTAGVATSGILGPRCTD